MSIKDRTTSAFVMLPTQLIEEIKKYKDKQRIRTRNEAIRKLIKIGLEAEDSLDS